MVVFSDLPGVAGADVEVEPRRVREVVVRVVREDLDDLDRLPDQLVYATYDIASGGLVPSPIPVPDEGTDRCDEGLVDPARWTRLNPEGMEDQIMILLTEVDDPNQPSDMVNLNRAVLGRVAPTIQSASGLPMSDVDLWIWRAGRTNLQPVPQYADWTDFPLGTQDGVPAPEFSTFLGEAGFAEDAWIGGMGTLAADVGIAPYEINYGNSNEIPVPERMPKCPATGRGEDDPQIENRGLPKDLALWLPDDKRFRCEEKTACSRPGKPDLWSEGLAEGEVDYVQGWRIRVPFNPSNPDETSSRDVRARGAYGTSQEKGYAVHTVEFMRRMATGNGDDLQFPVDKDSQSPTFGRPGDRYRMVVSVFDRANKIASGSTEIYLRFKPPTPNPGMVNRCQ